MNVEIYKSNFHIAIYLLFSKPMEKLQVVGWFGLHVLAVLLQTSSSYTTKRTAIFLS